MNLIEILNRRYSTKEFDSSKNIPEDAWGQMEEALRLSASSTNAQPWHFVVVSTEEGKKKLLKATDESYEFNSQKIIDASYSVLFCAKTEIDEKYLLHVLDVEEKDGRYENEEFKNMMHGGRSFFVNMHKDDLKDLNHWAEKQVYLNVGNALLSAAILGLDALPMEGMDINALNKEFGLAEKGLTASVLVSFGYHKESDFNADLPKSRLSKQEVITRM